MPHVYETDGAAIYRQSFATIRAEADLGRFSADEEPVAMVSSYLRSARNIEPEDADALEEIFRAAYKRLVRDA